VFVFLANSTLLKLHDLALRLPAFGAFKNIEFLLVFKWENASKQHLHVTNYTHWSGHDRGWLGCSVKHGGHRTVQPLTNAQTDYQKTPVFVTVAVLSVVERTN
jgi:hypothetical protein